MTINELHELLLRYPYYIDIQNIELSHKDTMMKLFEGFLDVNIRVYDEEIIIKGVEYFVNESLLADQVDYFDQYDIKCVGIRYMYFASFHTRQGQIFLQCNIPSHSRYYLKTKSDLMLAKLCA